MSNKCVECIMHIHCLMACLPCSVKLKTKEQITINMFFQLFIIPLYLFWKFLKLLFSELFRIEIVRKDAETFFALRVCDKPINIICRYNFIGLLASIPDDLAESLEHSSGLLAQVPCVKTCNMQSFLPLLFLSGSKIYSCAMQHFGSAGQ